MLSGDQIRRKVFDAAEKAVNEHAEAVREGAADRIGNVSAGEDPTPELSLEGSGRVDTHASAEFTSEIHSRVSFGRPGGGWRNLGTAGYAQVQHEREDFEHPRGGQARYLGDEQKSRVPELASRVATHIRRELG